MCMFSCISLYFMVYTLYCMHVTWEKNLQIIYASNYNVVKNPNEMAKLTFYTKKKLSEHEMISWNKFVYVFIIFFVFSSKAISCSINNHHKCFIAFLTEINCVISNNGIQKIHLHTKSLGKQFL